MSSQSHTSNGERERYERIAATAMEVAQVVIDLAEGGFDPLDLAEGGLDPLDLVVQNITTLVDDAVALAPHSPQGLRLRVHLAAAELAMAPPQGPRHQLATIDFQAAETKGRLADAINNARQLCKALAAAGGRPDASLLHAITAALRQISTDSQTLGQLTYDRTRIASSLAETGRATRSINTYTSVRRAPYEAYPSTISFTSPPAPASRDNDDQLRRGPRITGPTGF